MSSHNASSSSTSSNTSVTSARTKRVGKTQIVKDFEVSREKLGSGSYASVWKGWHRLQTDLLVAVKVISLLKLSMGHREKIESEIEILMKLKHDNIVQLYDVKKSEKHIILILEFCGGGDLSNFIKEHVRTTGSALEEDICCRFMKQLAQGMHFLHVRSLVHRDIKPQNLLLTSKDVRMATLKIADFGFARYLVDLAKTACGSPVYMAPEILSKHKYTSNVDLWSAGTVLYEMLFGEPPFQGESLIELQQNVEQGLQLPRHSLSLSQDSLDLLRRLLVGDPDHRISYADFFSHPFIFEDGMYDASMKRDETTPNDTQSDIQKPSVNLTHVKSGEALDGDRSALSVLISRSSTETQTSPTGTPVPLCPPMTEEAIASIATQVQELEKCARALWEVAERAIQEARGNPSRLMDCFVLSEASLSVTKEAVKKIRQVPNPDEKLLQAKASLTKFFNNVFRMAQEFAMCIQLGPHHVITQGECLEQIIVNGIMYDAGNKATADEVLGNTTAALHMYEAGSALLKHVLQSPALTEQDKTSIQKIVDAFAKRVRVCKEMEAGTSAAAGTG